MLLFLTIFQKVIKSLLFLTIFQKVIKLSLFLAIFQKSNKIVIFSCDLLTLQFVREMLLFLKVTICKIKVTIYKWKFSRQKFEITFFDFWVSGGKLVHTRSYVALCYLMKYFRVIIFPSLEAIQSGAGQITF